MSNLYKNAATNMKNDSTFVWFCLTQLQKQVTSKHFFNRCEEIKNKLLP